MVESRVPNAVVAGSSPVACSMILTNVTRVSEFEVLAIEEIRLHTHPSNEDCTGLCAEYDQWTEMGCRGQAVYLVDLRAGTCQGRATNDAGGLIQVPPDWWKARCERVATLVLEKFCG